MLRRAQLARVRAEAEVDKAAAGGEEVENPESEAARKKAEADRLRAAEKFMVVGTGEATCKVGAGDAVANCPDSEGNRKLPRASV